MGSPSRCVKYWAPQTRALDGVGTIRAHRTDVRILWPVDLTQFWLLGLKQQEPVVVRLHEQTVAIDAVPRHSLHQIEVSLLLLPQTVWVLA